MLAMRRPTRKSIYLIGAFILLGDIKSLGLAEPLAKHGNLPDKAAVPGEYTVVRIYMPRPYNVLVPDTFPCAPPRISLPTFPGINELYKWVGLKYGLQFQWYKPGTPKGFTPRKELLEDFLFAYFALPGFLQNRIKTNNIEIWLSSGKPYSKTASYEDHSPQKGRPRYPLIYLFANLAETEISYRKAAPFHEIAHYIEDDLDIEEKTDWLTLSGWSRHLSKGRWKYERRPDSEPLPSTYAYENPKETFAECFTAYRFRGSELKAASPKIYAFMKMKVFKGIEYTQESLCFWK